MFWGPSVACYTWTCKGSTLLGTRTLSCSALTAAAAARAAPATAAAMEPAIGACDRARSLSCRRCTERQATTQVNEELCS